MKAKYLALVAVFGLACAGFVAASELFKSVEGSPEGVVQAEQGTVLRASSDVALWIKTGGLSSTGWVKFTPAPLSGAMSGTAVLVNGTVSVTNTSFSTNSALLLGAKGVTNNAGTLTYAAPTTNGVVVITSSSVTDNRTVNWLSVGN